MFLLGNFKAQPILKAVLHKSTSCPYTFFAHQSIPIVEKMIPTYHF
jgi:hypothetical protein